MYLLLLKTLTQKANRFCYLKDIQLLHNIALDPSDGDYLDSKFSKLAVQLHIVSMRKILLILINILQRRKQYPKQIMARVLQMAVMMMDKEGSY